MKVPLHKKFFLNLVEKSQHSRLIFPISRLPFAVEMKLPDWGNIKAFGGQRNGEEEFALRTFDNVSFLNSYWKENRL